MAIKNRFFCSKLILGLGWLIFFLFPSTSHAQDWRFSGGYSVQNVGFNYVPNNSYEGDIRAASKGMLESELERYFLYRLYIAGKAEYLFQNQKSFVIGGPVNFQQANLGAYLGFQGQKLGIYGGVKAGRVWDINLMGQNSNDEVTWHPVNEDANTWTTAYAGGIKYYLLNFVRLQLEVTKTIKFPEAIIPATGPSGQPAFNSLDFNPISLSVGVSISIPWHSKKRLKKINDTGSLPILNSGSVSFVSPMKKGTLITSRYGPRWNTTHKGVDMAAKKGENIFAAADGVVVKTGKGSGYGKMVKIRHSDGFSTLYAHMRRIKVKEGQKVRRGDVVGKAGNTGTSTGVHLHFEVLKNDAPVDPQSFVRF